MYAIARYKLIDFLRRTKTSLANVPIEDADDVMADEDNLSTESTFDVRRLLAKLPSKVRCAIEAVKLDGQSVAEAAIRCGISESGVKTNIYRGLKAMSIAIAQADRPPLSGPVGMLV